MAVIMYSHNPVFYFPTVYMSVSVSATRYFYDCSSAIYLEIWVVIPHAASFCSGSLSVVFGIVICILGDFLKICVKNVMGTWIRTALDLQIAFGRMLIFPVLILPTCEHGREVFPIFLCLPHLKFLLQRSLASWIGLTQSFVSLCRCCEAVVKGNVSLISFLGSLLLVLENGD